MDIDKLQSQVATVPVKCRLEEGGTSETRLVLLRRTQLGELHSKLSWLFNLKGYYQLRYLDKYGDLVTFSSEEEFQLALSNHQRPEFRVLITPIESRFALKLSGESEAVLVGISDKAKHVLPGLNTDDSKTAVNNFSVSKSAKDFSKSSAIDNSAHIKSAKDVSAPVAKSSADSVSNVKSSTELNLSYHGFRDSSNPSKIVKSSSISAPVLLAFQQNLRPPGKWETDSSVSSIVRSASDLRPAIKTSTVGAAVRTVVKFSEPKGAGSVADCSLDAENYDWKSIFHPDYLRPRTLTSRRAPGRRRPPVDIQASMAGYSAASVRTSRSSLPSVGSDDFVHHGIECSRCGADPLVGWRYKCSLCPNYNLCSLCFESYNHGHGFYRLP